MIIVKIMMNALSEKRKEVFQTLLSMIEAIRQEKGCRSYHVFQDIEDENVFCLVEKWENREDMEHHMKSDRFSVLLGTKILLEFEKIYEGCAIDYTKAYDYNIPPSLASSAFLTSLYFLYTQTIRTDGQSRALKPCINGQRYAICAISYFFKAKTS